MRLVSTIEAKVKLKINFSSVYFEIGGLILGALKVDQELLRVEMQF